MKIYTIIDTVGNVLIFPESQVMFSETYAIECLERYIKKEHQNAKRIDETMYEVPGEDGVIAVKELYYPD